MMVPTLEHPSTIPAWIKLHKLPLEFWTAKSFSRIASTIGKPLHVDKDIEKRNRLDYARVCVEIDARSRLPDDIQVIVNGESVLVAIGEEVIIRGGIVCGFNSFLTQQK